MRWVHIHIEGQVQGVGFRPFVFSTANKLQLRGWVCNGVDGVHIEAGGFEEQIDAFIRHVRESPPEESYITNFMVDEISEINVKDFRIIQSNPLGEPNLLITPDLGLCNECRNEIYDTANTRFQYPFTTCTHCGPRYSIMKSLPYDRHTTSMHDFRMCQDCEREYNDPFDRRYYSQTNSCKTCTIPVRLVSNNEEELASDWHAALPLLIKRLKAGEIAAVKGIGGYLLMTDATNKEAINRLRKKKQRPTKPFALMYPDVNVLKKDAELSQQEIDLFQSIQSPVVLVKAKARTTSGICLEEVAPGLRQIGAMRPYTAMFELLMREWGKPIIATSGNITGSPIIYEDHQALMELKHIADVFLIHDREIQISEDDSVVRVTSNHQLMIRRSRGYAPTYLNSHFIKSEQCLLAMGADMKGTFALQANGRVYISQYLGDLSTYDSQQYFRHTLNHLMSLLRVQPKHIIVDAHPNYFSSQLGRQLAELWGISIEEVYHHQAHAWSVLSENDLIEQDEPVLCAIWDGTGYGEDHQNWGGEFFIYQKHVLKRLSHLTYFPMWQGDTLAKEPRLSALVLCRNFLKDTTLRKKFSDTEWSYYLKLIQTKPDLLSSSIGRLFDAVASLLDVCNFNTFEGEAAMRLEALAARGKCLSRYHLSLKKNTVDYEPLLKQIVIDLDHRVPPERIAYKFHVWLAEVVLMLAERNQVQKIALSGGVFQNKLLIDLIEEKKNPSMQLYLNLELSPNDENISLGQLAAVLVKTKIEKEELALSYQ